MVFTFVAKDRKCHHDSIMKISFLRTRSTFVFACLFLFGFACSSLEAQIAKEKKKKPVSAAMTPVEDVAGLPRVLLIGDSISIGYTAAVRKALAGKANVHRPLTNCGPTTRGLDAIDQWLETGGADKKWDVIHFNWGLHDLKYMGPEGQNLADPKEATSRQQVPPEEYRANLEELVKRIQKTEAKLIWRNTTPVPAGCKGRVVGDSDRYNKIAKAVMKEAGVEIHDLYTFALERQKEIQREANVHYSAEGSAVLGQNVAAVILKAL